MQRKKSKRRLRIRLALTYSLMVLSVVALLTGLYFVIQGYRFNSFEGQVKQGGLVQFNSRPTGASIWLDGAQLASKTQSKLTISAGSHEVSMWRDGYKDWKKNVNVKPGEILWLDYVRLIPEKIEVKTPISLTGVASALGSLDNKKMAVIEKADSPALAVINLTDQNPTKQLISFSADDYSVPSEGEAQIFELVAWAEDDKYVLIKHTYGSKTEWLSVDTTRPDRLKNITRDIGVDATAMAYSNSDANTLFTLTASHEVRRINIDQKVISGPLLHNIDNFNLYDNSTIAFATRPDAATGTRSAGYLTIGASSARVVQTVPKTSEGSLKISIEKYFGKHYLAVALAQDLVIYKGDLSASDAESPEPFGRYAAFESEGGVDNLGFSPEDHRFMYAQNAGRVTVYDLDLKTESSLVFESPQKQPLDWADGFHITVHQDGALKLYDYDGTNGSVLLDKALLTDTVLLENGRFFYGFQQSADGVRLSQARLLIN